MVLIRIKKEPEIRCAWEKCGMILKPKLGYIFVAKYMSRKGDIVVLHFCSRDHLYAWMKQNVPIEDWFDKVQTGRMLWETSGLKHYRGGEIPRREVPYGIFLTPEQRKKFIIIDK